MVWTEPESLPACTHSLPPLQAKNTSGIFLDPQSFIFKGTTDIFNENMQWQMWFELTLVCKANLWDYEGTVYWVGIL